MVHQLIGEDKRFLFEADNNEDVISNILREMIKEYGVNNSFVQFVNRIYKKQNIPKTNDFVKKILFLRSGYDKGDVDVTKSFYDRVSLYDRDLKDFAYTVNALELLSRQSELGKYIDNPNEISENILIDRGRIKSANEIYYILDNISQEKGKVKNKKYTLLDYLSSLFKSSNKYNKLSKDLLKQLFKKSELYSISSNSSSNQIVEKAFEVFSDEYNKGKINIIIKEEYIENPLKYVENVTSKVYDSLLKYDENGIIQNYIVKKK